MSGDGAADGGTADRVDRRRFLESIGALGAVGLAGCGGDGDDTATEGGNGNGATTTGTDAETGTEAATATETETPTQTDTPTETPTETPDQPIPSSPPTVLSFVDGDTSISSEETATISAELQNPYLFDLRNVEVTLSGPSVDWVVEATGETAFDSLESGSSASTGWDVTPPDGATGDNTLTATVSYESETDSTTVETDLSIFIVGDEIPQDGRVAYLSLDGDTPTNEITGTDATTVGDPTPGVTGVNSGTGDAFAFDGEGGNNSASDDGDAITTGEKLPINGETATIAAWVNWTELRDYDRLLSVAPDPVTNMTSVNGYQVYTNPNSDLRFEDTGSASGADFTTATGILSTDTWYFLVVTMDQGDVRLHLHDVEGELDGSPWTASPGERGQDESQNLVLSGGTDPFDTPYYSNLTLDEVHVYSRGLSEGEVAALYLNSF